MSMRCVLHTYSFHPFPLPTSSFSIILLLSPRALTNLIQKNLPGYTRSEAFERIKKVRKENGGKLVGLKESNIADSRFRRHAQLGLRRFCLPVADSVGPCCGHPLCACCFCRSAARCRRTHSALVWAKLSVAFLLAFPAKLSHAGFWPNRQGGASPARGV